MRSKTCSSKYVKTVSKGKGWLPAFLTLGYLLAFPVVSLLMIGNWGGLRYTTYQLEILYDNLWRDGLLLTGGVVVSLAAFLNGINGFLYLYSRKQTDFYHSLPVKRSRMFWNRVYTGLVYNLVPYVIMEFFAVCIGAARGFFSLKLMKAAVNLLLLHLLLYFMVYFSVVLVLCITGNLLMGAVCLGAIYAYGPFLSLLIMGYRSVFYHTYTLEKTYGLIRFLQEAGSPAALALSFYKTYSQGKGMGFLLAIIFITAVFAVLAYLAYTRRASEAAERPMVYKKAALVLKFLVVVPCGLVSGYIFYLLPTNNMRIFWWIFGLILGTVMAHGIVEVVYGMDFHCFFKKKVQLLFAGGMVAACALIYQMDLFHYDKYLPSQDKIEAISLNLLPLGNWGNSHVVSFPDHTYEISDSDEWDRTELTQPNGKGIGDETYQVLQEILSNQEIRVDKVENDTESIGEGYFFRTGIKFRLRGGKNVYRRYSISAKESKDLLRALYEEENPKEYNQRILELDTEYLEEIYYNSADGNGYLIFQEDKEKAKKLIEALKQDIQESDSEDLLKVPCGGIQLGYVLPGRARADRMEPGEETYKQSAYGNCILYPSYKNTMKVLKETGYPLTVEETSVKKVSITYYREDGQTVTEDYTDEKEIEAVKKAAVPVMGNFAWLDYAEDISVSFEIEQGSTYMDLLEENLPDFIKEKQMLLKEETAIIGGADGPTSIYIKEKEE